MSYLSIGTLFSQIEVFFAMFFDFIHKATEASFHTVLVSAMRRSCMPGKLLLINASAVDNIITGIM